MAIGAASPVRKTISYPTSDGKPMAETDWHRILMIDLIQTLDGWFAKDSNAYVSGNLLMFYVEGDRRRHLSPDVFFAKGVTKRKRLYYLVWEEKKGPDLVIELTSKSTRNEDLKKKFHLYQDVLKVAEYFLFDPLGDYLKPPLQGFRLQDGKYEPIAPIKNRLPSQMLRLHMERDGENLRLYDPKSGRWLPTPAEERQELRHEVEELRRQLSKKS
ncbi:MAG TPA: Uma2 family endonuclease [Gemmataceae bacterium]|jgi:Uma2 family endonuclease|nr:Uma2 family endonuclease [Gemmataceae bacterium]